MRMNYGNFTNGYFAEHKRRRVAAEKIMGGCIGIMRKQLKKRLTPIKGTGQGTGKGE
jgi:hypothetical protein